MAKPITVKALETKAVRNHVVLVARSRNAGPMRHKGNRRAKDRAARELRNSY